MAVIMISELPGAGPGFADVARQQGLFYKMKSAPGFMGHWSGATDTGFAYSRCGNRLRPTRLGLTVPSSHACPRVPNQ